MAAPGEAVNHDDEIMKLRLQPIHDGCTVDEYASRVNTAVVMHIPFLERPFKDASAVSTWVIRQLPSALASDGRSLLRSITAAGTLDDTAAVSQGL